MCGNGAWMNGTIPTRVHPSMAAPGEAPTPMKLIPKGYCEAATGVIGRPIAARLIVVATSSTMPATGLVFVWSVFLKSVPLLR